VKVLVTGGAGFIGSHLVEALMKHGHNVHVLDDFSNGSWSNLKNVQDEATVLVGDISERAQVFSAMEDMDVVFHLATRCLVQGLEDPAMMHRVNDMGTFNLCLAAKQYNVKIVYVGSSEEYGSQTVFPIKESNPLNPVSIYGLTKVIGEKYVSFFHQIYDIPTVILRPFNAYGPRHREDDYAAVITNFIKCCKEGKPATIYGTGLQTRDFSYISDIVDGILFLSKLENGEIINIGSNCETSILSLVRLIHKIWWGKEAKDSIVFDKARPNDINRLQADISLAKSYGYEPKISLEEGLSKYLGWYKNKKV